MRLYSTKYLSAFIILLFCLLTGNVSSGQLTLHLANQNQLPELKEQKKYVKTVLFDTYIISGWGLKAGKNETYQSFINSDSLTLTKNLKRFLKKYGKDLSRNFSGSILLDIEHPVHPIRLSNLSKQNLRRYIKAINMRVNLVKNFFPYAQIGLYGLFIPYQQCGKHKVDTNRLTSFRLGLKNGILNNLDFYTVVSYLRWKTDHIDKDINQCISRKIQYIDKYAKKYNIPYRPMLSLRLYNKKSSSDHNFVIYKYPENKLFRSLVAQLKIFQKMNIKEVIIYHPNANVKPNDDNDWSQTAAVLKLISYLDY